MFATSRIFRFVKSTNLRYASKYANLKYINAIESGKGYDTLKLNKAPVNSLNTEMVQDVIQAIDIAENSKDTKGLIITSNLPVFCAGLDILEMYDPKPDRAKVFWYSVQEMVIRLFSSPLLVFSAINGACPAGGCIFAFSADYRIMTEGKHTMGLNETKLGIAAPFWLAELLELMVGYRESERMLYLGELNNPNECLAKGMVDKLVTADQLLDTAERDIESWLKIPEIARKSTKMLLRRHFIDEFHSRRDEDLETFLHGIMTPEVQKVLGLYLQSLKKKK